MGISNTIQQLSVFLENREGRLDTVLKILAENDVNIVALSLADTSDYGMLRMIVSDPHKGKAALKDAGITAMLTDVVAKRCIRAWKVRSTWNICTHLQMVQTLQQF